MQFNPQPKIPASVLATDLDGTLIPLDRDPENEDALQVIANRHQKGDFKLVFATGRHLESVIDAIHVFNLPSPDWLVCDVGTSIFISKSKSKSKSKSSSKDEEYEPYSPYREHLRDLTPNFDREKVEKLLESVAGIELQSPERQQQFKISYSCESNRVDEIVGKINIILSAQNYPYSCTGSVDPFENCGLLDVLPSSVSKAYALIWLSSHADFHPQEVIFAGDSGNDKAALASGFRAILVGNASEELAASVESILEQRNLAHLLYRASGHATSGVLEGCRYFGML